MINRINTTSDTFKIAVSKKFNNQHISPKTVAKLVAIVNNDFSVQRNAADYIFGRSKSFKQCDRYAVANLLKDIIATKENTACNRVMKNILSGWESRAQFILDRMSSMNNANVVVRQSSAKTPIPKPRFAPVPQPRNPNMLKGEIKNTVRTLSEKGYMMWNPCPSNFKTSASGKLEPIDYSFIVPKSEMKNLSFEAKKEMLLTYYAYGHQYIPNELKPEYRNHIVNWLSSDLRKEGLLLEVQLAVGGRLKQKVQPPRC